VDTTGAGDCFAAACLHARFAAKLSWRDAVRFANCAAAISRQDWAPNPRYRPQITSPRICRRRTRR
jgi:sugar/nucleoside kinase (ribokinase family)